MFLFILIFLVTFSGCTSIDTSVNHQNTQQPYYTNAQKPLSKSYLNTNSRQFTMPSSSTGTYSWPVKGRIINSFGQTSSGITNKGINIQTAPDESVKAASGGKIVFADYLKGWGQTVIIAHSGNIYTIYANLQNIYAKPGSTLKKGDTIAQIASNSKQGSILHFEIRKDHQAQNPLRYLH